MDENNNNNQQTSQPQTPPQVTQPTTNTPFVQPPSPIGMDPVDVAMINNKSSSNRPKLGLFIMPIILIAVVIGAYVIISNHTPKTVAKSSTSSCINTSLAEGSSGNCVKDLQTMVDLMETNGLNQCPFSGSQALPISGQYDAQTAAQVKVVQTWINCYNAQEHAPARVTASGNTDASTWSNICTYGYQYPKQLGSSVSSYYKAALSAGSNAGC